VMKVLNYLDYTEKSLGPTRWSSIQETS
jgi:hypothetical protein